MLFLSFDLNNPDVLGVCIGEVDVMTGSVHTVAVPPQFQIDQEQMFIDLLNGKDCPLLPTVADEKVLDAILESSQKRCWVDIL